MKQPQHTALVTALDAAFQMHAPAVVVHLLDPMAPPSHTERVHEPTRLDELAPCTTTPFICVRQRGDSEPMPVLRADWWQLALPGDKIVFLGRPQGKGSNPLRLILLIALTIVTAGAALAIAGALGVTSAIGIAAIKIGVTLVGTALINAIAPNPQQGGGTNGPTASPTYSIALQGNQARPYGSRPVLYGREKPYPDFAAPPYSEFDADNDQYFCALYFISEGEVDFDKTTWTDVYLGNSKINEFEDVSLQVIEPGGIAGLTLVKSNMVTCPDVSDNEMLTNERIGNFAVCRTGYQVEAVSFDFVWPKGLYPDKSTTWENQLRAIDEYDNPTGGWITVGTETLSADTVTPLRRSYRYVVSPGRYQGRVRRTDTRVDNISVAHDQVWVGFRGELYNGQVTANTGTYIAVRMRANKQLSGMSQRRLSVRCTRKLPIWNGSTWSAPTATQSIAWAWADIQRNTVYGRGLADNRIDLARALALDPVWVARGDTANYIFDSKTTTQEAGQLIARCGRAASLPVMAVWTLIRDQAQAVPAGAIDMRTIERGSLRYNPIMRGADSPDGLQCEYRDGVVFDWRTLPVEPFPGVTNPTNIRQMRLLGITSRAQALKEQKFMVATDAYGRERVSVVMGMDGMTVGYGNLAALQHDLMGWGSVGEVTAWDPATLTATLSTPPEWDEDAARHYVSFTKRAGGYDGPYRVSPGASPYDVVLEAAPTTPYTGIGRNRTRYRFGAAGGSIEQHVVVLNVVPRGGMRAELQLMLEDNRRHTADEDVPSDASYGGAPVDPGGGEPESSVHIDDHSIVVNETYPSPTGTTGGIYIVGVDGTTSFDTIIGSGPVAYPGEWVSDAGESGLYDVRATSIGPDLPTTGTLDTWMPMSSDRAWSADVGSVPGALNVVLRIELRDRATETLRDSAVITFQIAVNDL